MKISQDLRNRMGLSVKQEIELFLQENQSFQRTPQTNTFNVKYYGGESSSFETITDKINADLSRNESYSLYIHYPYCLYVCEFCHYPVIKKDKNQNNTNIVEQVVNNYDLLLEKFPLLSEKSVSSLYIGGGTPSLLSLQDLNYLKLNLFDKIRTSEKCEFTIEATPDTLTRERIKGLVELGFNRLSVGIQILDNETLKRLNRDHNIEQALNLITEIKKYDNVNANIDLIYGLPGISTDKFLQDVETIGKTKINSITLYRLRLGRIDERKAILFSDYSKSPQNYPSQDEVMLQIIYARQILEELGYIEHPLGWFEHPENESQCYKDRWLKQAPLIGLGMAAYSYGSNWQYINCKNLMNLENKLRKNEIPFGEGIILNDEEAILRKCAFNLRYNGYIKLDELSNAYSDKLNIIMSELNNLQLGDFEDSIFKLNELGKATIDEIIDNYFQKFKSYFSNNNREKSAII